MDAGNDDRGRDGFLPMVTICACLWATVVFLGVNAQEKLGTAALARWGYITETAMYHGAFYGLLTDAFVHYEILHILFNLYWLWIFGKAFERNIGSFALLVFIVVTAFVSSGVQLLTAGMGIGLSGVGYALFGFCWMTRSRYPEFARIVDQRTIGLFLIWFVVCVVTTYTGIMRIANVAHLSGLAMGAAIGGMVTRPKLRVPLGLAVVALAAISVVPLFWNPLSEEWNADKADIAMEGRDYPTAIEYIHRALRRGADPDWGWINLAAIYGYQGREAEYRNAIEQLQQVDPEGVKEVEKHYGVPGRKGVMK